MTDIWEVDLRSRKTGNSVECIYSGSYDGAWDAYYDWYKKHPHIKKQADEIGGAVMYLVDGTNGKFADVHQCNGPNDVHGVGKFKPPVERKGQGI